MVTTIQLNEDVKKELDSMKFGKQTYEDVIVKLINEKVKQKKEFEKLIKEECEEFAEEYMKITEEFKHADAEMNKYIEW